MMEFLKQYALWQPCPVVRGLYELEPLLEVMRKSNPNLFIAGGAARYMLSPHKDPIPYGDIDIYTPDGDSDFLSDTGIWECVNHTESVKSWQPGSALTESSDPRWHTMKNLQTVEVPQIADLPQYEQIIATLARFDISNVRAAIFWDARHYQWRGLIWNHFKHCELNRIVDIEGAHNAAITLKRLRKYTNAGYTLASGVPALLLRQWHTIDPIDRLKLYARKPERLAKAGYIEINGEVGEWKGYIDSYVTVDGMGNEDYGEDYVEIFYGVKNYWKSRSELMGMKHDDQQ